MKIENFEEAVRPAVKEILDYIAIKDAITVGNMRFLIEKGLVDEGEYKEYMLQSKKYLIQKIEELDNVDKKSYLIEITEEEFKTYLSNF